MMLERLRRLIDKKVYIETSGGRIYNGIIKEVENDIIYLIDKFDEDVFISISQIKIVQVNE